MVADLPPQHRLAGGAAVVVFQQAHRAPQHRLRIGRAAEYFHHGVIQQRLRRIDADAVGLRGFELVLADAQLPAGNQHVRDGNHHEQNEHAEHDQQQHAAALVAAGGWRRAVRPLAPGEYTGGWSAATAASPTRRVNSGGGRRAAGGGRTMNDER